MIPEQRAMILFFTLGSSGFVCSTPLCNCSLPRTGFFPFFDCLGCFLGTESLPLLDCLSGCLLSMPCSCSVSDFCFVRDLSRRGLGPRSGVAVFLPAMLFRQSHALSRTAF